MNRRVLLNLITFGLLAAVFVVWAFFSFVTFGILEPADLIVTAEFELSPGLRPDYDVTYRGFSVGRVRSVELGEGNVLVRVDINHQAPLPGEVEASILRRSAVGEPYVDLTPVAGADLTRTLANGDVIPVERTHLPPEFGEAFKVAERLINAVEPSDIRTLIHELSLGLEGRTQDIRNLIRDAERITTTFAAETDLLDSLTAELAGLSRTFANHAGSVDSSFDDLRSLTGLIRSARGDISAFLEKGPDFVERLAATLAESQGSLGCLIDSLGAIAASATQEQFDALERVISETPKLIDIFKDVVNRDFPDQTWIRLLVLFDDGANSAAVIDPPRPLPEVRVHTPCALGPAGGPPRSGDSPVSGPGSGVAVGDSIPEDVADDVPPPYPTAAPEASSSDREFLKIGFDIRWLLGALLLAMVLLILQPWTWFAAARRSSDNER